jgi:TolB protein
VNPRWSPAGKQIAFLYNDGSGQTVGGLLLVAAADTGTVVTPRQPLFADYQYAWAPDSRHIAWTNARSDVSPVGVSALEVDGASKPVAKDTNAFSVTYGNDGQAVLFTNGDASGPDFTRIPFALRDGGIYSAATPGGAPANPPAPPTSLFTRQGSYYGDVAALDSGAVAFTEPQHVADRSSKSILLLDAQ